VNVDEKVVEAFDGNQAEPRKLHICNNVEGKCQSGSENHHMDPAARLGPSHAEASK
jgi:hypothetical protein